MQGLILAAGQSNRLGEPKILFKFEGLSLLARTCLQALTVCDQLCVVLGGETVESIPILIHLKKDHPNLTWFVFENYQEGMGSTLSAGFRNSQINEGPIMVFLCDLPFVQVSHIQALFDFSKLQPQKVIVSNFGGQNSPPIIIPFEVRKYLYDWKGDKGLGSFWKAHPEWCEELFFETSFRDLDTLADKEYWQNSSKN